MTVPDSLQTIGKEVFLGCYKLVTSYIDVSFDNEDDPTSQVVAYLRSKQQREEAERDARTMRLQHRQERKEKTK